VMVSSGPRKGTVTVLPRFTLLHDKNVSSIKFKRTHFPFNLTFAVTTHKLKDKQSKNGTVPKK
ncbi:MAG: hypothetical protein MHPSP_004623, partial [Paramarteilia canceri]